MVDVFPIVYALPNATCYVLQGHSLSRWPFSEIPLCLITRFAFENMMID